MKRVKKNTVAPIHEETSFGVDNQNYQPDEAQSQGSMACVKNEKLQLFSFYFFVKHIFFTLKCA